MIQRMRRVVIWQVLGDGRMKERTMRRTSKTKSRSIYRVLMTPSLALLLLFPLLACGIFYISATHYAAREAEARLMELRTQAMPVIETYLQDSGQSGKAEVGRLAREILPITRRIKGDTDLMVFVSRKKYLAYPREEQEQAAVQQEVGAFSAYIEETMDAFLSSAFAAQTSDTDASTSRSSVENASKDRDALTATDASTPRSSVENASKDANTLSSTAAVNPRFSVENAWEEKDLLKNLEPQILDELKRTLEKPARVETADGEVYLVSVYPAQLSAQRYGFLISYCPVAAIGDWVARASVLVLLISLAMAILLIAFQRHSAKRMTVALDALAAEAERIGSGDFTPIAREFTIEEMSALSASMNHMSTMLCAARESEQKFYQNVSHDLRTPLMSIGGYAQGIETGIMTDYMHAAHIISEESARLTQYVSDLLTLSRLENGEKFQLERLDLADCIEESFEHMNGLALQYGVELKVEMPERELLVEADAAQLVRILDNLISNAVRYAHHTVWIQVAAAGVARQPVHSANAGAVAEMVEAEGKRKSSGTQSATVGEMEAERDEGAGLILRVVDDGDGIRESELPHIFERSYKGEKGGFGFGLAIASNAARNMNATLSAGNRPEGGAVFTLRFEH